MCNVYRIDGDDFGAQGAMEYLHLTVKIVHPRRYGVDYAFEVRDGAPRRAAHKNSLRQEEES